MKTEDEITIVEIPSHEYDELAEAFSIMANLSAIAGSSDGVVGAVMDKYHNNTLAECENEMKLHGHIHCLSCINEALDILSDTSAMQVPRGLKKEFIDAKKSLVKIRRVLIEKISNVEINGGITYD